MKYFFKYINYKVIIICTKKCDCISQVSLLVEVWQLDKSRIYFTGKKQQIIWYYYALKIILLCIQAFFR